MLYLSTLSFLERGAEYSLATFEMPQESTNMFKRNMIVIVRYTDCLYASFGGGKYSTFCYAEFSRYHYITSNTVGENDHQLKTEVQEENHKSQNFYPKIIPMMSSKEKLKCQKIPLVLQYHFSSKKDIQKKMLSICCF